MLTFVVSRSPQRSVVSAARQKPGLYRSGGGSAQLINLHRFLRAKLVACDRYVAFYGRLLAPGFCDHVANRAGIAGQLAGDR